MSDTDRFKQAILGSVLATGKLLEQQLKSRETMLAELERRGYDVRGKTDDQVIEMIKLPPPGKS